MDAKNGGPAFPVSTRSTVDQESGAFGHQDGAVTWQFPGMTLRDYYVGQAIAGMCANPSIYGGSDHGSEMLSRLANQIADSAIAAMEAK